MVYIDEIMAEHSTESQWRRYIELFSCTVIFSSSPTHQYALSYTQRYIFQILLNQTEFGLYLPFSD